MFIHTRILAVPTLMALAGCAGTSGFIALEPNPNSAKAGVGYVDFYVDAGAVPCTWSIYQTKLHGNLYGGKFAFDDRKDNHVYLAELVSRPHRLVRVESPPGAQHFAVSSVPVTSFSRKLTRHARHCVAAFADVIVVTGQIVPVRLNFTGSAPTARIQEPVAYGRKEAMPYHTER